MSRIRGLIALLRSLRNRANRRNVVRALHSYRLAPDFTCPFCGYRGKFDFAGDNLHANSACPKCHALERHRLLDMAIEQGFLSFAGRDVLHFAPEPAVRARILDQRAASYRAADLKPAAGLIRIDLCDIALADESVDLVLCLHVLEHVPNDLKALAEIRRILRPGGEAILMVPMVDGWACTIERASITSREERHLYFGQHDHVRRYGRDFRDRVVSAGFDLHEFSADGWQCAEKGLLPGETVFKAVRPWSPGAGADIQARIL